MPEPHAGLWLSQADSDRNAARRLYDPVDHRSYCQTIAKHQQTVEKSIKAIAAAVRDADILAVPAVHYYRHDVDRLVSALRHLLSPRDNRSIQSRINMLLNEYRCAEIEILSALVPKKPGPGELHARNTEYPYETASGVWTAPALPGAFSAGDVDRFGQLAERVYDGARRLFSALKYEP